MVFPTRFLRFRIVIGSMERSDVSSLGLYNRRLSPTRRRASGVPGFLQPGKTLNVSPIFGSEITGIRKDTDE